MADAKGRIFPLVDRRAPVLDRIRNGRHSDHGGEDAGRLLARNLTENSPDEKSDQTERFLIGFVEGLADELGVPESAIDEAVAAEFYDILAESDETDVFTEEAQREYDLHDTDTTLGTFIEETEKSLDDEDGGEDEDDEPSFSDEE